MHDGNLTVLFRCYFVLIDLLPSVFQAEIDGNMTPTYFVWNYFIIFLNKTDFLFFFFNIRSYIFYTGYC